MKNLHLISTEKPSRLFNCFGKLEIGDYTTIRENLQVTNQHIYITSDEKTAPSKGDWYLGHPLYTSIHRWHTDVSKIDGRDVWINKIILTTDQDLIKDGVQAIDDTFLEWFVNNPSCEEVEVQKWFDGLDFLDYKIIIPQEETKFVTVDIESALGEDLGKVSYIPLSGVDYVPKEEPKQETLEEAVQKYSEKEYSTPIPLAMCEDFARLGAKWQAERSYSEEIDLINWLQQSLTAKKFYSTDAEDLLEQFKKK